MTDGSDHEFTLSYARGDTIVENYRKGDRVCQRIVRHVGIAMDEQEELQLKNLGLDIITKLQKQVLENSTQLSFGNPPSEAEIKANLVRKLGRPQRKKLEDVLPPSEVPLSQITEVARVVEGVHETAGVIDDQLYGKLLDHKKTNQILKDLVMARLVQPCSKYQSQKILLEQFLVDHDLDAIYRTMDKAYEKIDLIKQITFGKTLSLFPEGVHLLFFDVTTLYFESTHVDELRNSKDHQLVLALATNPAGLPVGYELFEGNQAEVGTNPLRHGRSFFLLKIFASSEIGLCSRRVIYNSYKRENINTLLLQN